MSNDITQEKAPAVDMTQQPSDDGSATNEAAVAAVKAVKAGRAKDVDIAAQILAQYSDESGQGWTEEEEKKLIRKVDWMIVPIVRNTPACLMLPDN